MPDFKVRKGQDAYIFYETIVQAPNKDEAFEKASNRFYEGEWFLAGHAEFDDADFFYDKVEEVAAGTTLDRAVLHDLSNVERDAILASLRLWQRTPEAERYAEHDIFTNMGIHDGLTIEEIDDLCERLNE